MGLLKIITKWQNIILKTGKVHMPTMENTKNAPSTMRVIYLVHDRLDLFFQFYRLIWLHDRFIN